MPDRVQEQANVPKRSHPHLRIAHSILEAIIVRDFTELEQAALLLILRLSWGCGKEWAYIPRQADFELCGIYQTDIRDYLTKLRFDNVIFWNEETHHFAFNKMFEQWRRSYKPLSWRRRELLEKLIKTNCLKSCPAPTEDFLLPLKDHLEPTPHVDFVSNLLSDEGEKELSNSLSSDLEDSQVGLRNLLSSPDSVSALPLKKVNKEENKDPSTPPTPPTPPGGGVSWEPKGKNFGEFCKVYEQNIGMLTPIIGQELDELCQTYSLQWFQEAVKEAVLRQRRHLKYVTAILDRWGVDGYKAPFPSKFEGIPGRPPKGQLPTGDELEQAWKGKKG